MSQTRGGDTFRGVQSGQALVEMALVLFILLFIILGGINAIQIAMANYTVAQAARAAAHEAALTGGDERRAGSLAKKILDAGMTTTADKATITVACAPPPGLSGCPRYSPVTVDIVYKDRVWASLAVFDEFTAHASSQRTTEQDRRPATGGPATADSASHARQERSPESILPGNHTHIPGTNK